MPGPAPAVGEDADRIIVQNTVFSEENYWDYWDSLLRKNSGNDNNLVHTWQKAAARESRRRLLRFLLISVALLGLLGGIVGEQLGLWSLRGVGTRVWETVRQRVALLSETVVPPEAGPGRVQKSPEVPLLSLPSGNERANAGMAMPQSAQDPTRKAEGSRVPRRRWPVSSVLRTYNLTAPECSASDGHTDAARWREGLSIKKVVIVRSGDTPVENSHPRIWGIYQSCRRSGQSRPIQVYAIFTS